MVLFLLPSGDDSGFFLSLLLLLLLLSLFVVANDRTIKAMGVFPVVVPLPAVEALFIGVDRTEDDQHDDDVDDDNHGCRRVDRAASFNKEEDNMAPTLFNGCFCGVVV